MREKREQGRDAQSKVTVQEACEASRGRGRNPSQRAAVSLGEGRTVASLQNGGGGTDVTGDDDVCGER